jgi:hypothetical protein
MDPDPEPRSHVMNKFFRTKHFKEYQVLGIDLFDPRVGIGL